MPPKNKFSREQILSAALDLVRETGFPGLTARSLAARLGASPKVIFGLFRNMEEVQQAVLENAYGLYLQYRAADMARGDYPPYKASGLSYIRFAREERELFRLLFMRDRSGEPITDDAQALQPILELVQSTLGLSPEEAWHFHMESWIFVHGFASMVATGYLDWDEAFVEKALTDVFQGLKHQFC